ncbi:hypothetical protein GCM10028825_47840 [Spirosoma agri]
MVDAAGAINRADRVGAGTGRGWWSVGSRFISGTVVPGCPVCAPVVAGVTLDWAWASRPLLSRSRLSARRLNQKKEGKEHVIK